MLRKSPHAVKKFSEHHFSDSLAVYQEIDIVIYMNICKNQFKEIFLEVQLGKHRYFHNTSEKDRFAAWQFHKTGLIDDIDTEDSVIYNIFSKDPDTASTTTNVEVVESSSYF
jgi:hypothetical protein